MPGYTDDLAYIHHTGFGYFARAAAPALLAMLRRNGIAAGLVLDLGCGTGIWAAELLRAGYSVLGVDISPSMIRLARRHAPAARFRTASLLDCELPPCQAVTAMGECLNYTFDPHTGPRALAALFRRVYAALRPGGLFVFDFAEPGQPPDRLGRAYVQSEDWAILGEACEDRRARTLVRHITTFRKVGKLFRKTAETHTLRLYDGRALLRALVRAGFRARLLRGYGKLRLGPGHVVLWARKPPEPVSRATC